MLELHNKYQSTVFTITMRQFAGAYVRNMLDMVAGVSAQLERTTMPNVHGYGKITYTFPFGRAEIAKRFEAVLTEVFRPEYLTFTKSNVNTFADDWELFDYLLSSHDWLYKFSDDPRVYRRGEDEQKVINAVHNALAEVDGPRADALYEKHRPKLK